MSDRPAARKLTLVIGAIVAVLFLVAAYTIVFEGCNTPDNKEDLISPPDDGVGAPGTAG